MFLGEEVESVEEWEKFRDMITCIRSPLPYLEALSKLLKREGRAGAEGAILPYVSHLLLISTLKTGADCCQLCQYKLTKPNLTYSNPEE